MFNDPTAQLIDGLDYAIQDRVVDFINELRTVYQLNIMITSGRRTQSEQAILVQQGRSTTLNSLHLSGHAFDLDVYGQSRDRVPETTWQIVGPTGEDFGFEWGGRWKSFRDVGHFQL
jgi:peptidoglycan L-alanyl-D-glutamate endopeptidase CwlK